VDIKEGLRRVIAETRRREEAELVPHVDDQPGQPGQWTVRDTLAHLTAWRAHTTAVLDAARTGVAAPDAIDDIDGENANIYAAARNLAAKAVIQSARQSWDSLLGAVEASSQALLRSPRPGRPNTLVWETVPSNVHAHLAEHLGYLAEARDDATGAEAAARWAHDLDVKAFPDLRQRGNADYNLACFFAKRRRADEALPLLREAFRLNPDLKAWALKDGDLDPLRSAPDLASLLA
jgi:tetratricopeptide (TPR) repeat protein